MSFILEDDSYVVALIYADNAATQTDVLGLLYRPKRNEPFQLRYRFRHRSGAGEKNWYEIKPLVDMAAGRQAMKDLAYCLQTASRKTTGHRLVIHEVPIESSDRKVIIEKMKDSGFFNVTETLLH